jgi:hypothetical protein
VTNGSGTVAGSNVASIAVNCVDVAGPPPPQETAKFGVGGTIRGVVGTGLTLRLNGVEDLPIASNGAFAFDTRLPAGATYAVAIRQAPANPSQSCTIARGSGTIAADVTNIEVTCAGVSRTVGGAVSGLIGDGLVLQNNGADDLRIESNGPFTFGRALADGSGYRVTVRTRPSNPSQTCTIANGAGTLAGANVTDVSVVCETSNFTVGGTVSGLAGSRLILRNNGGDEITIDENGRFTFPTGLPSGARYDVAIASQPVNPAQECNVSHGSGTVGGNDVTSVDVRCATAGFKVGVRVDHLRGDGLVLQNNGGDDLHIGSNGRFNFPTPLPSGSSYNVTVARQPTHPSQSCRVEHGSGTVRDKDVRDPRVRCH